jgi:hypothetical protein
LVVNVRHAVIEAQHGALEAPDEGDVKVPAHQQALGAELEPGDLLFGERFADLVVYANVGAILA